MGKSIKKPMANFHPFEGRTRGGGSRHIRITKDMMRSPAWKGLKPIAVKLYVYLKLKYRNDGVITFTCTYAEILSEVGLSDRSAKAAYDDLIKRGFIEVVENNRHRMQKNVYRFSDKWTLYELPPDIPPLYSPARARAYKSTH